MVFTCHEDLVKVLAILACIAQIFVRNCTFPGVGNICQQFTVRSLW